MRANNINNRQNIPSFGKFIKIKGHTKAIAGFREELKIKMMILYRLQRKKRNGKSVLYIFSGKHLDKFLI